MVENWISKNSDKIKNAFYWIILVTCIVVTSSCVVTKAFCGKSSVFGYKPFFIMSGSMEPTIMTHQIVIATPIDAEDVQIGDIISYETDTKTVIHRVVDINEDGTFEFLGDNNAGQVKSDKGVTPEQIGYKIVWY